MPTTMLLKGHTYRLPNGWTFIATPDGNRYALFSRTELHSKMPAAFALNTDGRVTFRGFDTGWRTDDLRDMGLTENSRQGKDNALIRTEGESLFGCRSAPLDVGGNRLRE